MEDKNGNEDKNSKINDKINEEINEETSEEVSEQDIRKAKKMAAIGIILAIAGFAFIPCGVFMAGKGVPDNIILWILVPVFLGCNGAGIILVLKAYPYLVLSDAMNMDKKYDNMELFQLQKVDEHSLKETLLKHGFVYTEDGYYRKKKFSFLKDYICYYVQMANGSDMTDVIRQETYRFVDRFNAMEKKERNVCLLLFVYMDRIGEREKKEMKEADKRSIIQETVINPYAALSFIIIAVDGITGRGYFLDVVRGNVISIYSHGCKLLKKL